MRKRDGYDKQHPYHISPTYPSTEYKYKEPVPEDFGLNGNDMADLTKEHEKYENNKEKAKTARLFIIIFLGWTPLLLVVDIIRIVVMDCQHLVGQFL